ncbi:hypothetical protein [Thermococcus sp. LS2]|uniref:hypothetical protein n=1 Tax=Thermococcus sp. LS2 TaxID=1638260 RepID=UPI00143A49DF|nr:hypothetical protein [Thermococcus sp. LS2]NJE13745.1 hypothetical protein [Thermococcus sp. LS2]
MGEQWMVDLVESLERFTEGGKLEELETMNLLYDPELPVLSHLAACGFAELVNKGAKDGLYEVSATVSNPAGTPYVLLLKKDRTPDSSDIYKIKKNFPNLLLSIEEEFINEGQKISSSSPIDYADMTNGKQTRIPEDPISDGILEVRKITGEFLKDKNKNIPSSDSLKHFAVSFLSARMGGLGRKYKVVAPVTLDGENTVELRLQGAYPPYRDATYVTLALWGLIKGHLAAFRSKDATFIVLLRTARPTYPEDIRVRELIQDDIIEKVRDHLNWDWSAWASVLIATSITKTLIDKFGEDSPLLKNYIVSVIVDTPSAVGHWKITGETFTERLRNLGNIFHAASGEELTTGIEKIFEFSNPSAKSHLTNYLLHGEEESLVLALQREGHHRVNGIGA